MSSFPAAWAFSSRTQLVLRNIAAASCGRVVNLLSTFFSVPLAIGALGQERYGILAVVISLTIFFNFADLGLGVTLVTELAEAEASGDHTAARRVVCQIWFFLLGCSALIAVLGGMAFASGLVGQLLPRAADQSMGGAWLILIGSSALGIPLAIAQRIFFALQMGAAAQAWAAAGRIAVLVGALAAAYWSPRLETFVAVFALLPNLIAAMSVLHLFFRLRPDLRPSLATLSTECLHRRMLTGINFTLLQLLNFAEVGIDTALVAQFYDSQVVAQFDLLSRLFGYISAAVGIGMWPLWPAISTAVAQHDQRWILQVRRSGYTLVALISMVLAAVFFFWSERLIRLWTGIEITLPNQVTLGLALACFVTLANLVAFQQVFLTAFNDMARQSSAAIAAIVVVVPLKFLLLNNGMLYGVIVSAVITSICKLIYFDFIVRRNLKGIVFTNSDA